MLRLTFLVRRKEGMSREEMQQYWLEEHGPLVAGHSRTLGMLRYVQVHTTDDDHSRLPGRRGEMQEPYDGAVEVEPAKAPWSKAVVVRLPCIEDEEAGWTI